MLWVAVYAGAWGAHLSQALNTDLSLVQVATERIFQTTCFVCVLSHRNSACVRNSKRKPGTRLHKEATPRGD